MSQLSDFFYGFPKADYVEKGDIELNVFSLMEVNDREQPEEILFAVWFLSWA